MPLYPSHDQSDFAKALNCTSVAVSAALLVTDLIRKPDDGYVYHTPAAIDFAVTVIRFLRNGRFVNDIQDLWPDTVVLYGMISNWPPLRCSVNAASSSTAASGSAAMYANTVVKPL